jgi:hypothetical protein
LPPWTPGSGAGAPGSFGSGYRTGSFINHWKNVGLAPDGTRFVAPIPVEGPEPRQTQGQVIFLENFSGGLRWKVPPEK